MHPPFIETFEKYYFMCTISGFNSVKAGKQKQKNSNYPMGI